ncbi:MAG: hypothetical protein R2716_08260 [Microthrixaceae bacterium]
MILWRGPVATRSPDCPRTPWSTPTGSRRGRFPGSASCASCGRTVNDVHFGETEAGLG